MASLPVAPSDGRRVIDADWIRQEDHEGIATPPVELRLGSRRGGSAKLWVRFTLGSTPMDIDRAFLVLEPSTEGPWSSRAVPVKLWPGPSTPTDAPVETQGIPELISPAFAAGSLRATPRQPARVDVTQLLRSVVQDHHAVLGLILHAQAGDDLGARFSSGVAGPPPRLEIYTR